MHLIDRGAGVVLRFLGDHERVFRDGWGDSDLLSHIDLARVTPPAAIEIEWDMPRRSDRLVLTNGRFVSPVKCLPEAARQAQVRLVKPSKAARRVCVLLPAWNDEGYATRMRLAKRLAAAGVASILLEAAFYGQRRVDRTGSPIRTVSDFALLSRSVVDEGRAIVSHLVEQGRLAGVSGYSMGGSLAAVVAATVEVPLAVTLLAASYSPHVVFLHGVLRDAVAWKALEPGGRERLADVLETGSVLSVPPSPATRRAVIVAARGDGFVPAESSLAIHHHWPGSEMQWVNGGHASLLWTRPGVLAEAMVHGFDRATWGST